MNKLSKREAIAVFIGIAVLAYLLFSSQFMSLFNQNPQTTNMIQTGFTAQDLTVGGGEIAEVGDVITVHYVGRLTNGQVFDSSRDRGAPFTLTLGQGQVIRGWDEGLVGMRAGGTRVLTIAPDYAYGERGAGTIPPNSVLIFEVEVLDIQKAR